MKDYGDYDFETKAFFNAPWYDYASKTTISGSMPTFNVNGTLPLKTNQKFTKRKVTGLADGDSAASWESSNTKVVKMSGKSDGICTLTAQNKTGRATITVKLASGSSKKLSVTLNPLSSTDKITDKSSNKKVATVSSNGVVKAKKKGTATITIKGGKKTKKVKVTVK